LKHVLRQIDPDRCRLEKIPGIGPLAASALVASIGIHGARAAILAAKNRVDNTQGWLSNLLNRRHANIAAVALANKNARTVWAYSPTGADLKPTMCRHAWPHNRLSY